MLRVTANTQLMKEIVDLLSVLTEEAKLVWKENGLQINVVDGSHVALLSATIGDACFETYEVEPVEIGLELVKLRDLLSLAGPSDLVELDYDEAIGAINVRVGAVHRILRGLDTSTTITSSSVNSISSELVDFIAMLHASALVLEPSSSMNRILFSRLTSFPGSVITFERM